MNRFLLTVPASAFALSSFAAATISDVTFTQESAVPHVATVTYKLADGPAIVTIDIQTNTVAAGTGEWASIGGRNLWRMGGDVNRLVKTTSAGSVQTASWCPDADWPCVDLPATQIRAVVTAWDPLTPPDYLAADLQQCSNNFYYASADFVPGGVLDARYKERFLLMRRIHAKDVTWRMGSATTDDGYNAKSTAHLVKITHDYWMGVFELTRAQYALVKNSDPVGSSGQYKPTTGVAHDLIRDASTWPTLVGGKLDFAASHALSATEKTFCYLVRVQTGLDWIDLPTEAEWEFAARAGVAGALYSGKPATRANMEELGQCYADTQAEVGRFKPNAWGLYDTLGNAGEWTLDRFEDFTGIDQSVVYEDPYGNASHDEDRYVTKGGNYGNQSADYFSTHSRLYYMTSSGGASAFFTFRLAAAIR